MHSNLRDAKSYTRNFRDGFATPNFYLTPDPCLRRDAPDFSESNHLQLFSNFGEGRNGFINMLFLVGGG